MNQDGVEIWINRLSVHKQDLSFSMHGIISADREWGSGKRQRSYNMSGAPSLAPHLRTREALLSISANIAPVIFTMLVIINRTELGSI